MKKLHEPVLLKEFVELANPERGEVWIDATAGFGGHTKAISERVGDDGLVIAIEKDPAAYSFLVKNLQESGLSNVRPFNADYISIREIIGKLGIHEVNGVLFDLGISSFDIDMSGRGFSYRRNEPLDMRFDPSEGEPLHRILKRLSKQEIADIIYFFGEERASRRIASAIYERLNKDAIYTTGDLNEAIASVIPHHHLKRVLPRVYQAFRIFVNHELDHVAIGLARASSILATGGRMAIISYHSLEDRIAKQLGKLKAFRQVNKKVIRPSDEEKARNPRSRSAKMRVLLKVGEMDEESIYNHIVDFVPRLRSGA